MYVLFLPDAMLHEVSTVACGRAVAAAGGITSTWLFGALVQGYVYNARGRGGEN